MCIDTFRIATNSDFEVIAHLVNEAYRPEFGATGWTHESDLVAGRDYPLSQGVVIPKTPALKIEVLEK